MILQVQKWAQKRGVLLYPYKYMLISSIWLIHPSETHV